MALYRDFPQHWHLFSSKSFTHNKITHQTHCKILKWYNGADGAKTGYIAASGFNLMVTAAMKNNQGKQKRMFVVVMGGDSSKSRDMYAAELMDKYFKGYKPFKQDNNKLLQTNKNAKNSLYFHSTSHSTAGRVAFSTANRAQKPPGRVTSLPFWGIVFAENIKEFPS